MGVLYSNKIINVLVPNVTKSTSRYKTKLRLSNIDKTTKVRFMRKDDVYFDDSNMIVHVVLQNEACRPDIIATKYFGNEKYSWVILAANGLSLPYQLKPGMKIVIPSLYSLQGSKGKLVTR